MSAVLKANGNIYSGWLKAEVTRSLKAVSGHFDIRFYDKWKNQESSWQLKTGDACSLELDGEQLIKGMVDTFNGNITSEAFSLSVTGRDLTGNLVDSGSLLHQKAFKGQSLKQMAEALASPFGVKISSLSTAANTPIEVFTFQYNETIWEIINRLAHYQGVLAYPDANGGIIFSDVGKNIIDSIDESRSLNIDIKSDSSQKFQKYIVVSHSGTPDHKVTTQRAVAIDNTVTLPRTKIIILAKKTDTAGAQARANWEMAMQIAKSFQANVTLEGWRNSKGNIWQINNLVTLNAPSFNLNGNYLIEETKFIFSQEKGMTTELVLVLPDAYKPQPDREVSGDVKL